MRQQTSMGYRFSLTTGYANYSSTVTSSPNEINIAPIVDEDYAMGKYSVLEIANWFLSKEPMAHKKLQKLCYYAQAWFITLKNIRLCDAVFEAWVHGPVSPVLYERFKEFGYSTIRIADNYIPAIVESDIELLESVWQTYGGHTGNALEALSHKEQPWIDARSGYKPSEKCNVRISLKSMRDFYKTIYIGGDA